MPKKKIETETRRGISPVTVLFTGFFLFFFSVTMLVVASNFVFGEKWKEFRSRLVTKLHQEIEQKQQESALSKARFANAPKILSLIQTAKANQTNCDTIQFNLWSVRKQVTELRRSSLGREISVHSDLLLMAGGIMHASMFDFPNSIEIECKIDEASNMLTNMEANVGTSYEPGDETCSNYTQANLWSYETALAAIQLSSRMNTLIARASSIVITKSTIANPPLGEVFDSFARGATFSSRVTQQVFDETFPKYEVLLLRQRAVRFDVRQRLAAFLAPGYYAPGGKDSDQGERSYKKTPMSLSMLRATGALDETTAGVAKFAEIGTSTLNDRPKLKISYLARSWYRTDSPYRDAQELQAEMIQLGPAFVDLHMMLE